MARLLESGDYERHVNRVRARARGARDGLAALVRKTFPAGEVSIEYADAGLYCTVALAEDKGRGEVSRKALADARISYVNIADCLWTGDRASTKNAPSRVLIQYDDLSSQSLSVLQEQLQ